MSIIVTGGAGFIGSNFVLDWLQASREPVIILDKLTYAGNPENFATVRNDPAHQLVQGILVTLNWSAACWQSMLPGPFSISQPNPTSIAPYTGLANSFKRTSSARSSCWKLSAHTGEG